MSPLRGRKPAVRALAAGIMGGLYGAVAMTALKVSARRAGLADKMVPELIEEWLVRDPERGGLDDRARRPVASRLLQLAYGAAWGALTAPALARARRGSFLWGAGLGAGLWASSMLGLLPRHRPDPRLGRRAAGPAQAASLLAHLLYGLSVQLAAREAERNDRREGPPVPARQRERAAKALR